MRVFDFDNTIYNGESVFDFYLFSIKKNPKVIKYLFVVVYNLLKYKAGKTTMADLEEADLKYRALKMVLSADDPNILYIEKHFSVNRDENVIDYVKNRVAAYEDSVLKYNEMVRMAAYKDSVANELRRESNSIKRTIKNYQ